MKFLLTIALLTGLAASLPAAANTYSILGSATAGYLAPGYSVVGVTDINGDGTADIIYQDGSGNIAVGGTLITTLTSGSYVVGAGNNNETGHGIILIQDGANNLAVIDPRGARADPVGQAPPGYRIVGVGGAVAQGQLLIAWQNAAGDTLRWRLDAQPTYVLRTPTDWGILGSPIFGFAYLNINAQGSMFLGYPNLYFQRPLGNVFSLSPAPGGYNAVAVADFNGDNQSDILWYNPSTRDLTLGYTTTCGYLSASGTVVPSVTYASLGTVPAGFLFAGHGDINGDGAIDLVFYNSSTYEVRVWVGAKSGADACSDAIFPAFSFNQGRP